MNHITRAYRVPISERPQFLRLPGRSTFACLTPGPDGFAVRYRRIMGAPPESRTVRAAFLSVPDDAPFPGHAVDLGSGRVGRRLLHLLSLPGCGEEDPTWAPGRRRCRTSRRPGAVTRAA